MSTAVGHGLHAAPWSDQRPGAHAARAAKFYVWAQAEPGHGCPISMTYAVVPALRHAPALAGRFEPLLDGPPLRPGPPPAGGQGRPARRHGHDREAGRVGRAGEHHPGRARARDGPGCPPAHRAQVVLLRPDVRPVPHARPRARRPDLLPAPPRAAGRRAQRPADRAAQGQARQPVQRLRRDRARRRAGLAGRRGRPGRRHDHRDGQRDQARLRGGQRRGHAPGDGRGGAPRQPPPGVRQGPGRACR